MMDHAIGSPHLQKKVDGHCCMCSAAFVTFPSDVGQKLATVTKIEKKTGTIAS